MKKLILAASVFAVFAVTSCNKTSDGSANTDSVSADTAVKNDSVFTAPDTAVKDSIVKKEGDTKDSLANKTNVAADSTVKK